MNFNSFRWIASMLVCGALFAIGAPSASAQVSYNLSDSDFVSTGDYVSDDQGIEPAGFLNGQAYEPPAAQYFEPGGGLPRSYARAEYLLWWIKGNNVPPLLTTSPTGTPRAAAGVLDAFGTSVLVGTDRLDAGERHGGRLTIGHWLDDNQTSGIELSFLGLGGDDSQIFATSPGTPGSTILARPFFNVQLQEQDALLVALPNVASGNIGIQTDSEFYSGSISLRQSWRRSERGHIDLIGGYRYARFREGLNIRQRSISLDPGGLIPVGTQFDIRDSFLGQTDFHGGEFGMVSEYVHGAISLTLLTKLAVGAVRQKLEIAGQTAIDQAAPVPGGLLALPSNIGTYRNNEFALLPELGLTLGCQLTSRTAVTLGYNLIYLTEVLRTGDQIDFAIDPSQVLALPDAPPGPQTRPAANLRSTSLWAQGLQFGLEFQF